MKVTLEFHLAKTSAEDVLDDLESLFLEFTSRMKAEKEMLAKLEKNNGGTTSIHGTVQHPNPFRASALKYKLLPTELCLSTGGGKSSYKMGVSGGWCFCPEDDTVHWAKPSGNSICDRRKSNELAHPDWTPVTAYMKKCPICQSLITK